MSSAKSTYQEFCRKEKLPIYFHPVWMNAVTNGQWDVVISYDPDGKIQGSWVFYIKSMLGMNYLSMPRLTPFSGVWLNYPKNISLPSKGAFEKKVLGDLHNNLPKHAFLFQQFHPQLENWLPLKWLGYSQTTSYTYQIKDISDLDLVYKNFKGSVRTDIKKAEKEVQIKSLNSGKAFMSFQQTCFDAQGKANPYDRESFKKIDKLLTSSSMSKIYVAENKNSEKLAAVYIIVDDSCAYYFSSCFHPDAKKSAALSYLVWNSIKECQKLGCQTYDFEGSVIPGIEHFVRNFGGELVPQFRILRSKNKLLRIISWFKSDDFYF